MALKPQDVYVVLKLVADGSRRAPYSHLALELVMSPSEVHASVRRAQASGVTSRSGVRKSSKPRGPGRVSYSRAEVRVSGGTRGSYAGSCNLVWGSAIACAHRSD